MAVVAAAVVSGCSLPTSVLGPGPDGGGLDVGMVDANPMGPDTGIDANPMGPDAGTDVGVDAFTPPADTGVDVGPDAFVAECTGSETRCNASMGLDTCVGGHWVIGSACTLGCSTTGTAHCMTFDPSNVAMSTVPGTVDVTVSTNITISTDACTGLTGVTGRLVGQDGGGPMACLFDVRSLTVASGATVAVTGGRPLIIVSQRAVSIIGVIDASSYSNGTARIGAGGNPLGHAGADGSAGTGGSSNNDGGGGGGGFGGKGGNGANEMGGSGGGMGGPALPSTLVPLIGGARGGSGSGIGSSTNGGAGGGAIQITSFESISITGTVAAAGAGGFGGGNTGGGGGGGSGGGILIEAPTVTLGSSGTMASVLVAGGGGGGGGCGGTAGSAGADGFSAGLGQAAGATSCGGMSGGGAGGGGATADGATPMNGGGTNAPGGGGGVGRIVFHTTSGAVPAGSINPTGAVVAHPVLMIH